MPMSTYVRNLRERIGHQPLMLQSVTAILFDEQARILIARNVGGRWMTIGGAIDPEETPADAVVRESWEETGLLVEPVRIIGTFGGSDFRVTYDNGDVVLYTTVMFEVRRIGGKLRADAVETLELRFVSRADVPDLPMAHWTRQMLAIGFDRPATPFFQPPTWSPAAT